MGIEDFLTDIGFWEKNLNHPACHSGHNTQNGNCLSDLTAEDAPAPMRWDRKTAAKLEVSLPAAPGLVAAKRSAAVP